MSPEFLFYMLCTYPSGNANKTLIIACGIGKTEKNTVSKYGGGGEKWESLASRSPGIGIKSGGEGGEVG